MNVRELIEVLGTVDPDLVVEVRDIDELPCHVQVPLSIGEWTVRLDPGDYITEEDVA